MNKITFVTVAVALCLTAEVKAQVSTETIANSQASVSPAATPSTSSKEALLMERIEKLERRLAELEAKLNSNASASINTAAAIPTAEIESTPLPQKAETDRSAFEFLSDTTFNVTFDGYYGYNFNRPVGGVNLLRAYDVTSNSFSLNQAAIVIENAPNLENGKRRSHVLDTYYTFTLNNQWTLAVEADYAVGRVFRESPPATVWGGAGYASYQWTPKFAVRGRLEYLAEKVSPSGGLFSGITQALKEATFTAEYKLADGFLLRGEYRRDWSNQPFFLTEQPGMLKKEQNTATLGLVWWLGRKQGTW